jgi:hypothetical protein
MHGEENRESRLPHTRRRPAQSRHNAYRRHKKTPALVSEAQLIRLDVLRVSYARSLSWQRQLEGSGRLDRGQSRRHAGGVRNCVSGINASGADGASLRLYGRVSVAVMASSRAGSLPQKSGRAETTKPSHFCEGFVLYGAAPGVELYLKSILINKM